MKKTLVLLASLSCMIACSEFDEEMDSLPQKVVSTKSVILSDVETKTILVKYLTVVDSQYVLNITCKEAEELGVSKDQYENSVNEVSYINQFIRDAVKNNEEICLANPHLISKNDTMYIGDKEMKNSSSLLIDNSLTKTLNNSEEIIPGDTQELIENDTSAVNALLANTKPSYLKGAISASDNKIKYESCWFPSNINGVRFFVRTNSAIVTVVVCITETGGERKFKTGTVVMGKNSVINVLAAFTNIYGRVGFGTMDSNGAVAIYVGIYDKNLS